MAFDSIINRNEYFSAHYLDSLLSKGLQDQRDRWTEAEEQGEDTARKRLRGLGTPFFDHRAGATEDGDELRSLHDAVLTALGFAPERETRRFERGGHEIDVPLASGCEISTGPLLVAVEAGFATDVDEVLGKEGSCTLLDPPVIGETKTGKPKMMDRVTDVVAHLFACDEPPRYVMVLAGGIVVLADRAKWGEGKYLAVNLDDALGRNDTKAKGELETIAGLFSADVLEPVDGQAMLDQLVDASRKHAVGVSADLRDGLRESIELLANEVIKGRIDAKLGVYNGAVDPKDLTTQCLRYLYRVVFLLFAEARPELGILPVDHPEYAEGYGLDRLRELALSELKEDRARNGTHLQESLALLFELVNDGYRHTGAQGAMDFAEGESRIGLVFQPLKSDLFAPTATPLLNNIKLRNETLRRILELLMLSKPKKGAGREFVSYANLGINQLGAVYEGLMAYTGFFATEDLFEVAKNGDPHKGSWVVPVTKAAEYPDDVFVQHKDEDGLAYRVLHAKGSFVFRLSGRARQRSASFYTPKVLTECVVRHSLAELLDQDDTITTAHEILELTICEPALGSGAFLNEAIDQLAAEYLKRRENEMGGSLDPEAYLIELQKVKAHIALHQCYGVDLNATAVELAEVSLWLNAMYPGLQAPWFGLHLRRGNSLVGARRATYSPMKLNKGAWLKAAPTDRKLADGPIEPGEVHHFLLPAHGWGAVADAKEAKELRPDEVKRLKEWRATHKNLTTQQVERLQALSRRVESLWESAGLLLGVAEKNLRREIQVWEGPAASTAGAASRADIERALTDPDSALGRLRLVMDAWCALWFWPVDSPEGMPTPPSNTEWLQALEAILGTDPGDLPSGQLDLFADLQTILAHEDVLAKQYAMKAREEVFADHAWLQQVSEIRGRESFFHWELEFASNFQHGGFALQVGNPPWVRPVWEDDVTLAEFDPWFGVADHPKATEFRERRIRALEIDEVSGEYLGEVAAGMALVQSLGSTVLDPSLVGVQTNLYLRFISQTTRNRSGTGIVGLIHPEGHFSDPDAGIFREVVYHTLRRRFQFFNLYPMFPDAGVTGAMSFGVHIYGSGRSDISFTSIASLLHPSTIEGSYEHNGEGEVPSLQYPGGGWDLRPHRERLVNIDEGVLGSWSRLFDDHGTSAGQARLLRPSTRLDLAALEILSEQTARMSDSEYQWSRGFEEDRAKRDGIIEWHTAVPASWDEVVLQGPHFTILNPFAKQPRPNCRNNQDYEAWDLEDLPATALPRTNYRRSCEREEYDTSVDHWHGLSSVRFWRLAWRRMTQPGLERSLHSCIIPPGPMHVHAVHTLATSSNEETARVGALWSSLPFDYLVKISGKSGIQDELVRRFPLPDPSPLDAPSLLRTLRLNCLTEEYAPLWNELFKPAWLSDQWTDPVVGQQGLQDVKATWSEATPLRADLDRRKTLVELDALAALMLGLSADQLCAMYRSQFAVLRKYEYRMAFDANGRKIAKDHQTAGVRQRPGDWEMVSAYLEDPSSVRDLGIYKAPFFVPDREKEMRVAYEEFARRYEIETP